MTTWQCGARAECVVRIQAVWRKTILVASHARFARVRHAARDARSSRTTRRFRAAFWRQRTLDGREWVPCRRRCEHLDFRRVRRRPQVWHARTSIIIRIDHSRCLCTLFSPNGVVQSRVQITAIRPETVIYVCACHTRIRNRHTRFL